MSLSKIPGMHPQPGPAPGPARPREKWLPRPRKFSRLPHPTQPQPENAPSLTVTPPALRILLPAPPQFFSSAPHCPARRKKRLPRASLQDTIQYITNHQRHCCKKFKRGEFFYIEPLTRVLCNFTHCALFFLQCIILHTV